MVLYALNWFTSIFPYALHIVLATLFSNHIPLHGNREVLVTLLVLHAIELFISMCFKSTMLFEYTLIIIIRVSSFYVFVCVTYNRSHGFGILYYVVILTFERRGNHQYILFIIKSFFISAINLPIEPNHYN